MKIALALIILLLSGCASISRTPDEIIQAWADANVRGDLGAALEVMPQHDLHTSVWQSRVINWRARGWLASVQAITTRQHAATTEGIVQFGGRTPPICALVFVHETTLRVHHFDVCPAHVVQ